MVADRYANDGVVTPLVRITKEELTAALKERPGRAERESVAD